MTAETAGSVLWRSGTAVFQHLRSRVVQRISWGLADQAVSSLTNFGVSIYVARTLGAAQFGAFSLAYVTYGFALNASRGLATDPLMVRCSGVGLPAWRRAVADCTGTAAMVGLAVGSCVLAAAALIGGTAGAAFLALGLTLPGLLLQDSWRYSFFALGRGSQAFLNDTVLGGGLAARPGAIAGHGACERVLVRPRLGRRSGRRRRGRAAAGPGRAQAVGHLGLATGAS